MTTSKYILVKIFISSTINRMLVEVLILIEVYDVEDLKANLLIRNNTLKL